MFCSYRFVVCWLCDVARERGWVSVLLWVCLFVIIVLALVVVVVVVVFVDINKVVDMIFDTLGLPVIVSCI